MKRLVTLMLLAFLSFLPACLSSTEEAGMQEISEMYGGRTLFKKGTGVSTGGGPQGSYLEVDLATRGISKYYSDMQLPASNCAYLVYKHLTPHERPDYNYFKISIQDSTSAHTYTFLPAELELADKAGRNLNSLLFALQGQDYASVSAHLDPAALGGASPDSAASRLRKIMALLAPLKETAACKVQGFKLEKATLAGQPTQLVGFLIAVPRPPERSVLLAAYLNPTPRGQRYLCGLRVL